MQRSILNDWTIHTDLRDIYDVHHDHNFMLNIYDTDLSSIDPYDLPKTQTRMWELRVETEVIRNPWYFFRCVLKLPHDRRDFKLNLGNLALIRLMLNNATVICRFPRQCGVSTTCAGFTIWEILSNRNTNPIYSLSFSQDSANCFLMKVREMWDMLPEYLKRHIDVRKSNCIIYDNGKTISSVGKKFEKFFEGKIQGPWVVLDADFGGADLKLMDKFDGVYDSWHVFQIHGLTNRCQNVEDWKISMNSALKWKHQFHALSDDAIKAVTYKTPVLLNCNMIECGQNHAYLDMMRECLDKDQFDCEVLLKDEI